MLDSQILIVGAGPTGMTTAIELKRLGMDVRIIDKSDHMARYSQALVVQARTLEQFQRYGLAEAAIAHGRRLHEAKFYSNGKLIVDFMMDGVESRYPFALFIPQSETELLLNSWMESLGLRAERGVELVSLSQNPELRAMLRHADGRIEEISPPWVIGCDGAHSTVREKTGVSFEGGGVGLSFFLGDCDVEGPDVPQDELSLNVHHGDVLFMARLSEKVVRLIAALHDQSAIETNGELTVDGLQRAIDRVGARVKIKSAEWLTPFHVNDRQAKHYRVGSVFLAGDAAHIHSPVGGQGMNTGIQDAANLAWKLEAVSRGAEEKLLDSYEEERGEVGKALLRFTERGLKLATTANPVFERMRDTLGPVLSKLSPIQRNAAAFVSETGIAYRESPIVKDYGGDGRLRAGDRLPDFAVQVDGRQATLLSDWTAPKHRIFGLNIPESDLELLRKDLSAAEVMPISSIGLDHGGRKLLGDDGKFLVLRPDGYVGFRAPIGFQAELMRYARQLAIA